MLPEPHWPYSIISCLRVPIYLVEQALGLVVAVAAVGALAEEFLFRGLIQKQAMQVMRPLYAFLLTVLLFGTLSLSHFSGWALPLGLLTAAILSAIYAKTQSLLLTITLNLVSKMVYLALISKYLLL